MSETTALDAAEAAFKSLLAAGRPLAIDGAALGYGLPARTIGLAELRSLVDDTTFSREARDVAWSEIVRRAHADPDEWTLALMGLLMSALRRAAAKAAVGQTLGRADIDAEVVTGFLDTLRTLEPTATRIPARLYWGAYRHAARAAAAANGADHLPLDTAAVGVGSLPPPGHPDLVLSAAVKAGAITKYEAELIGTTRIDEVRVRHLARQDGTPEKTLYQRRERAEQRLIAWMRDPTCADVSNFRPKTGVDRCGSHRAGAATAGDQELHGSTTTRQGGEAPDRTPTCSASRPAPSPTTRIARSTSQRVSQPPCPSPWPSVPPLWWPVPFPPPLRTRPPRRRSQA